MQPKNKLSATRPLGMHFDDKGSLVFEREIIISYINTAIVYLFFNLLLLNPLKKKTVIPGRFKVSKKLRLCKVKLIACKLRNRRNIYLYTGNHQLQIMLKLL